MIPMPANEILAMFGLMALRLGAPLLLIFLLGFLTQRVERLES